VEIKPGKGGAEILALAQDRQPGQARLEAFEADLLEQADIIGYRPAPFVIVIGQIVGQIARPETARAAILAGDQAVFMRHGTARRHG
jgi:hypothetical protein